MRKSIILISLALALIAGALAGGYVLRAQRIKAQGVELRPRRDFPIATVTPYQQDDPAWADEPIGASQYTMGSSGCLLCSVSSALSGLGIEITPQRLNEKMASVDGYLRGADLVWSKLKQAVPGVDYRYSRTFSAATLESDLAQGLLPIVKVKYRGSGVQHWLLVVGAEGGEFLALDPLNQNGQPIPLSAHGRVYAYRVLVPKA